MINKQLAVVIFIDHDQKIRASKSGHMCYDRGTSPLLQLKAGMHNIRPAEGFNLARETPNFASFFDKNTIWMC